MRWRRGGGFGKLGGFDWVRGVLRGFWDSSSGCNLIGCKDFPSVFGLFWSDWDIIWLYWDIFGVVSGVWLCCYWFIEILTRLFSECCEISWFCMVFAVIGKSGVTCCGSGREREKRDSALVSDLANLQNSIIFAE